MDVSFMKRVLFLILFFASVSASAEMADSIAVPEKRPFFKRLVEVVKEFSRIDTNYIEPQHYNFTAMLQNTNTYESYTLRNEQGQEIVLSPEPSIRIGPYIGWRWLFLGYTIDVSHLNSGSQLQDWNLSFYSNQVGVDLFYRKTGEDSRQKRQFRWFQGEYQGFQPLLHPQSQEIFLSGSLQPKHLPENQRWLAPHRHWLYEA